MGSVHVSLLFSFSSCSGGTTYVGTGGGTSGGVTTYEVTVEQPKNGTVTAKPTTDVAEGAEVTLEIEPETGYKLDELTVKDGGNNAVSTTEVTAGAKYTFKMPASNVKVSATFKATGSFGSKASPDAVGDIVFKDGSAEPYTADLTDAQKQAAVAVIFFKDATKKLGVGLKQGTGLAWATGTTGRTTKFNTSETDGSGNWDVIKAADSTGAAAAATNYPAFNFANTYGVSVAGNADDWYLPAKDELKNLCDNYRASGSAVKEALDKCTGTIDLSTGCFWSSSQYASYDNGAISSFSAMGTGITRPTRTTQTFMFAQCGLFNNSAIQLFSRQNTRIFVSRILRTTLLFSVPLGRKKAAHRAEKCRTSFLKCGIFFFFLPCWGGRTIVNSR